MNDTTGTGRRTSTEWIRASQRAGLPPGSLDYLVAESQAEIELRLFDVDLNQVREQTLTQIEQLAAIQPGVLRWLDVEALDARHAAAIAASFALHALVMEDALNYNQRPKFEDYGDYLFLAVKQLRLVDDVLLVEHIGLVVWRDKLLTIQQWRDGDVLDSIRQRLRRPSCSLIEHGAGALAHAILDCIVDHYFVVLEQYGERVDQLETALQAGEPHQALERIQWLRRQLMVIRHQLWPVRDVMASIQRCDSALVDASIKRYFRDVHDHLIQLVEMVEVQREVLASLHDLYLTTLSLKNNHVIQMLTVVATIFMPLTFLAGLWGMNFDYMPELEWHAGYPLALLMMATVGCGLTWTFRRHGWI